MPLISVELGVTVSMFALVVCLGTPAIQLRKLNQPLENAPVQLVWACVVTVDAAKSAIAASNLDETNLQPPRAGDVAPRWGPDGKKSMRFAPHFGPQSIGNADN